MTTIAPDSGSKLTRAYTKRFVKTQPPPSKKKNQFFSKLLIYMGLREEEEEIITEAEKIRRYNIAMNGWKKVKKTLTIIRYRG